MKKDEVIDRLKRKYERALQNRNLFGVGSNGWMANEVRAVSYNIAIDLIKKIEEEAEPAPKVEVPNCVSEWYESHKDDLEGAISDQIDHGHDVVLDTRKAFDVWFFDESDCPIETLIRMKDGYTAKPKRWVVKSEKLIGFESFISGTITPLWTTEKLMWMTFVDKSKAEAVAVLVEGTVEEV